MFHFKLNRLCKLPKPVELSHNWILTNFKYQEPESYTRLFDYSEEGYFEVPTGFTKAVFIIKLLSCAPNLYVFQESNSVCLFCSFSSEFVFVGEK